ncbi:hypothetical protein BFW01_g584 [Lasiodiplodia theobromae]|nr:hypothetical protein BFW01_g584 [Lasiodiplodia theobromae]
MAPSTFHHQGTLPESSNSSPSSHSLDIDNSLKAHSPLKSSILQSTGSEVPRTSQPSEFPIEVQLSFSSALEQGSVAPFLLERIRNFREGNEQGLPTTGFVRRVRQKDYEELNELLGDEPELEKYASDTLRIVYNSKRRRLSYDMSDSLHESTIQDLTKLIDKELGKIADKWQLPDIARKRQKTLAEHIRSRGQITVKYSDSEKGSKPDMNWIFTGGKKDRSCFALEVANSQSYKDIRDKVKDVIGKSGGFPGMNSDKAVSFSIAALRDVEQEDGSIIRQVDPAGRKTIRDSSGRVQNGSISFTVKDMLGLSNEEGYEKMKNSDNPTVATYTAAILDSKIELSYASIAEIIEDAEKTEADGRDPDKSPVPVYGPSGNYSPKSTSYSSGPSEPEKDDPSDKAFKGKNPQGSGEGVQRRSQRLAKTEEAAAQTLGKRERSDSNESSDST